MHTKTISPPLSIHANIDLLMLIKRRPPQFTGFVENKYRREHVMIINLYIVSVKVCLRDIT